MAGAPEKYTKEQMIAMARECKGMAYVMARRLGCSPKTVYNYRDRYPEVAEAMEDEDGMVDDIAELKLFEAIKNGEAWAIRFRLKHKGHGRGYCEKQQVDVTSDGGKLEGFMSRDAARAVLARLAEGDDD
jgi:hypothetical protein